MNAVFLSSNANALKNVYPDYIRRRISSRCDITGEFNSVSPENADALTKADYIFSTWGMPCLERGFIASSLPNLKAVFYGAGSVQGFAREFLEEGRIVVSAWAANAIPVAEFTVSQIVLSASGYFQRFKKVSCEKWSNRGSPSEACGGYHMKVGLIGAGMVGRAVIRLLKNYVFDVYVYDPFLSDADAEALGVTKETLEYIFAECPIISNHLANNPQTVGMLDKRLFDLMQPTATFINTGRGAQVVEDGLASALRECPSRVALLDVTYPEPPVEGSELYRLDNCYISPHIAGSLGREVERMGDYMCDEFEALLDGRPLRYSVTLKMLETMA